MHRNNSSKRPLAGLIAALALLAAPLTDALAETVTYNLNQSNVESVLADGVNYLQVAITSNVAGTASFSVTPVFNFAHASNTNYGLQSFGFNYTGVGTLSFSGLNSNWELAKNLPANQDGFGAFDYVVQGKGNSRISPLTFTVSGISGASTTASIASLIAPSEKNGAQDKQYFAAHLTGISYGNTTSGYFAGSTLAVPEPESYAMLLAGLGFVGMLARRRRIG